MIRASLWDSRVACGARYATLGGQAGYCAVVKRCVTVVDARLEIVMPADAKAGERDISCRDAELFATAPEALYDWATQLERKGGLDGWAKSAFCGGGCMRWIQAAYCLAQRWHYGVHLGDSSLTRVCV